MREIKFRAWDIEELMWVSSYFYGHNVMFDVSETEYSKESKHLFPNAHTIHNYEYNKNDWIVMQYTGLKDKNGVEIYEGDILICPDDYKHIVEWNEISASFVLRFINNEDYTNRFNDELDSFNFEVIGNIHENKNLLKDK